MTSISSRSESDIVMIVICDVMIIERIGQIKIKLEKHASKRKPKVNIGIGIVQYGFVLFTSILLLGMSNGHVF